MAPTSNVTVKELSARMDKLSELFHNGMKELEDNFNSEANASTSRSDNSNNDILFGKLKVFEKSINDSLNLFKNDLEVLKIEMNSISDKMNNIEMQRNNQFLIIHGFKEDNDHILDGLLNLFNTKLGIDINKFDISHVFRMGKNTAKTRPVAVKFVRRWMRDLVFSNKKKFKGSSIVVTEMLTTDNMKIFQKARSHFKNAAWTFNGLTYVEYGGAKKVLKCENDVDILINS
ncbi:unnamed protein product [Phaedon cochleariae]|uniref:Zinc finger DNA binding protein n=1 Tax=Phaedon cochleariae TaxID=80249 RepID=A0A9N9X125_PHACE|nr:unnamed protein product [Phaedon cochleariae]